MKILNLLFLFAVTFSINLIAAPEDPVFEINFEGPVAICMDAQIYTDPFGIAFVDASMIDGGSFSDVPIVSMEVFPNFFECTSGEELVTLTVTDENGLSASCTATVTIIDNWPLEANIPEDVLINNDLGLCEAYVAMEPVFPFSMCPEIFVLNDYTWTNDASANYPVGETVVTWTVSNSNTGFGNNYVQTVTVVDNEPPTAVCQDITAYLDESGSASIVPTDIDNGSSDNCSVDLALDITDFTCGDVGVNAVVLTVTDPSGHAATCNATVEVLDAISPALINCPSNTSVYVGDVIACNGFYTITPPIPSDNCSYSWVSNPSSVVISPPGDTIITYSIVDPANNSATCSFTITVIDTIRPQIIISPVAAVPNTFGECAAEVTVFPPTIMDCSEEIVLTNDWTNTSDASAEYPVGTTTITWTATDSQNNTSTASQDITVLDNQEPTIFCPNDTVTCDPIVFYDSPQVVENCPAYILSQIDGTGLSSGDVFPQGETIQTYTVIDAAGFESTCSFTVTVIDTTPPLITPNPVAPVSNMFDQCSAEVTVLSPVVDDCSDEITLTNDYTGTNDATDIYAVGTTTITWTATDNQNNTSTASQYITVIDDQKPIAICNDLTVTLDASGNASITPADLDGGSSDNCGITLMEVYPNTFTSADLGVNLVALLVADESGNADTCEAMVTVQDITIISLLCQDANVYLDANGQVSISASDVVDVIPNDELIDTLYISQYVFDCADIGENLIIATVMDTNGLTDQCTSTVTVIDSIAPTVICNDYTVALDQNGVATITPDDVNGGSTDNCGIDSLFLSQSNFSCDDLGNNPIELLVTDLSGNTASCMSVVSIFDIEAPLAICLDTLQIGIFENQTYELEPSAIDLGSTDNCEIILMEVAPNVFDASNVGFNPVVLSVYDAEFNESMCTSIVNLEIVIGLNEEGKQQFSFYPNPNRGLFELSFPPISEIYQLTLLDITGKTMFSTEVRPDSASPLQFRMEDLKPGVYILSLTGEKTGNTEAMRMIVK